MRRLRRAKIVATLGPASSSPEMIEKLFVAGADVFRINMSHTSHDRLNALVKIIRDIEDSFRRPISIMVDLQGPKLRLGTFAGGSVALNAGDTLRLDNDTAPGDRARVGVPHPEIFRAARPGDRLLVNDGLVRLTVAEKMSDHAVTARAEADCVLSDRKGISLPDTELSIDPVTPKDSADLAAGLAAGADWIALSFVQHAADIERTRTMGCGNVGLIAKIEKPLAVRNLSEIVRAADGLMIARGDLGVEMPVEQVPGLQKQIIRTARQAGKPVVVATQMLESMGNAPVPTRAEVSDVAGAVYDGADAVMLSAESASGDYPEEAVAVMDKIACTVEKNSDFRQIIEAQRGEPEATSADAIAAAARQISETLNMAAIVCYTQSGATGLRVARERPRRPIVALSPLTAIVRRLAIVWGIHCVVSEDAVDVEDMSEKALRIASREGFARKGERIIVTAGVPFGHPGRTNMVKIAEVMHDY